MYPYFPSTHAFLDLFLPATPYPVRSLSDVPFHAPLTPFPSPINYSYNSFFGQELDALIQDGGTGMESDMETPHPLIRPHTARDMYHDLATPHFSNCTVPVVFFLYANGNFGEVFERLHVLLWAARQKDAWDPRYSILFNTMGQAMTNALKLFRCEMCGD